MVAAAARTASSRRWTALAASLALRASFSSAVEEGSGANALDDGVMVSFFERVS